MRILKSGEQGPEVLSGAVEDDFGRDVYRGILVNRKKNGDLYYVEESISPVRDNQGQITHFISNGRDLTRERLPAGRGVAQAQKMDAIGHLRAVWRMIQQSGLLSSLATRSWPLDSVHKNSPLENKIQEISSGRRAGGGVDATIAGL